MAFDTIDDDTINALITAFYAKVRNDPDLGPIFAKHIGDVWDEHLKVIGLFWSNVMLADGRYTGNPMGIHLKLSEIHPRHFEVWLGYWRETSNEMFNEDLASAFIDRAERIAESLQLGMFNRIG